MKIAVISYRPIGTMPTGSRRIIIDLAVGLKREGFHIDIYNTSRRGHGCPDDISLEGVGCVELPEDLLRRALLLPPRILTLASREALLFIKLVAQFMVDRVSRVYQELADTIDSRGYDLAILETIYLSHLGSLLRSRGIPAMLRLHNVEAEYIASLSYRYLKDIAYRSMKAVEWRSLRMISNRIAISLRDKEIIKKLYNL
ncbi:MAG: glycosyltransferase, partial [Sulfolobales archaeon]